MYHNYVNKPKNDFIWPFWAKTPTESMPYILIPISYSNLIFSLSITWPMNFRMYINSAVWDSK